MLEVDNAGNHDCAFLAFSKGLIWLMQGELKHGGNRALLKEFCNLSFVDGQEGFSTENPDKFIQEMNLQKEHYFLQRVQAGLRRVLVDHYFSALQVDLNEIEFAKEEQSHAIISRNDNITELLTAVYHVLNRKIPVQNDFFCDAQCQEKIIQFVNTLVPDDMRGEMIIPSRLKKFLMSVFSGDSSRAESCSHVFSPDSVGACVIARKAKKIWGTFNDLTILARYFDINLVVVNMPASVTSSLQDSRAKIYLKHTSTIGHHADHWTTILNVFPYSHCALLPERAREFEIKACSFHVSKLEIAKLFVEYIESNFAYFCFWNNRDHLKLANEILKQCDDSSQTAESILNNLITSPPAYNRRGEFAAIMNYLCYRQFGISYEEKCQGTAVSYEQLIGEARLTEQDITSYRPLTALYDEEYNDAAPLYAISYAM